MGAWWRLSNNDGYVNAELVSGLSPVGSGSSWRIRPDGSASDLEAGPYTSEADAAEAIRKLVGGIDPSTIV